MPEQVCENCRWWDRHPLHPYGDCRRNPPMDLDGTVPQTAPTDRCGEWSDKTITPEQEERRELIRRFAVALISAGMPIDDTTWNEAAKFAAAEPQIQREQGQ